ncbi:MAG TPA: VCBS repeat-containing protein [Candidatus Acidoferrales bacterium]|nr:VCBS repeat-containing protein [Candidatus Acidoferrales bacterium]
MNDIAEIRPVIIFRHLIIQMVFVVNIVRVAEAQVYTPVFRAVEMQATIAPLGEMVAGNFSGHNSVAALCRVEKAIYFFEPDSMENLILANVVTLPDTPIAISKGQEIFIDTSNHERHFDKLAVLESGHSVMLVSFGKDGRPIVSQLSHADAYATDVRTTDLEARGKLDIITFGKFCPGVFVAGKARTDSIQDAQAMQTPLEGIPFSSIAFTDFNGDLVPDMAALDWVNHRLLIFYGRGDGTFAQPVSFQLRAEPSTLAVADLTGDGYPDILIGYNGLDQIDLYGGDGVGRFLLRQTLKTAGSISKFALADFTGNGAKDIAALSSSEKQITLFSYDVSSKDFKYSGTVGVGENYDDIIPFYFPNRLRADLVASSLSEKYVKVFKTSVIFNKYPDVLLPVSEGSCQLSVFGNDTSNCMVAADTSGRITLVHYNGTIITGEDTAFEFRSEENLAFMKLVISDQFHLLSFYTDTNTVSMYDVLTKDENGRKVMTARIPFLVDGTIHGDSAIMATAYTVKSDSGVGISYFTSYAQEDFIEKDYYLNEAKNYVSSALTLLDRDPAFFRISEKGIDTMSFVCTRLRWRRTVSNVIQGSKAKLAALNEQQYLFVEYDDTLTMFKISLEKPMILTLHQTCAMPFDSSEFSSVRVSIADSVFYVAFFDSAQSSVSLFSAAASQSKLIRSWRTEDRPEDIAVLPVMRRIYFLNRPESYVSVHNF